MSVTITTIQPQDSIAASRLTINSNFNSLKTGIDSVQTLLDPTTSALTGVKAATINNSAYSISQTVFQVGQGSSLLGNVIMGTTGAATSVLINGTGGVTVAQGSQTLSVGNLTLSGSSSIGAFGGHLSVANELRLIGSANAFSNMVSLTASGSIPVTNLKYLVIKNSSTTTGVTASLGNGNPGQVVEIFHALGASGYPVTLSTTNFYGLTGGVKLTQTGDTLKCVYDGSKWYLWSYNPASFANALTATLKKITSMNSSLHDGSYYSDVDGDDIPISPAAFTADIVDTDGTYGPYVVHNVTRNKNTSLSASVTVVGQTITAITLINNASYLNNQWGASDIFTLNGADSELLINNDQPDGGYGVISYSYLTFGIATSVDVASDILLPAGSSIVFQYT